MSSSKPGVPAAGRRLLARVAPVLARVVAMMLMTVGFAVIILPAWLCNRLAGIDVLGRPPAGWTPRDITPRRASSATAAHHHGKPSVSRRLLRATPVVLVVIGLLVMTNRSTAPWADIVGLPVSEASFPGEPWGAEVLAQQFPTETEGYLRIADDPFGWELADYHSPYVNITDGFRETSTVPNPVYTVWLFGGSVTFGIGQRDDHTIASELVHLAMERGVLIEVVNFGVTAYSNWQSTEQFIERLEGGTKPDLAVFDGINDWYAALERQKYGLFGPTEVVLRSVSEAERARRAARAERSGHQHVYDVTEIPALTVPQYRRGVRRARRAADAAGVDVVHFWQPELATMPLDRPLVREVIERANMDALNWSGEAAAYRQVIDRSGVDPIDITHIFDEVDQPIFFDSAHTNEAGARIEAEAILDHIWPLIRGGT